CQQNSNWPLAF
nr:immunoglobulin light chain junction region [Macaca mulatta]MOW41863.1 immunoglobulin light chain junction region [Macaca mulatta]